MPRYTFRDIHTGEEFEDSFPYEKLDNYLKANPNLEQVFKPLPTLDSFRIGIAKPPADFQKHVLGRIKDKYPDSYIGNKHFNIPKEI